MKKIELLSPAGNMESLKAAVAAGCDAVYLGLQIFSARAFAGNFSHEELIEAVRYCHLYRVRVYVTLNTMLYEEEMPQAMKEAEFLYENDVDALLIQDLGLFQRIHRKFPDFDLHCSTQMHIHNAAGVKFMQRQGAARIVIARETPLEIIRECCQVGAEIEVFAYGALCISYSGQCLMSAAENNRSGNRGMCAQCCRLRYHLHDGQTEKTSPEGEYLLSPKDLNIINRVPELLDLGVSSLKIEGRMKRPEYVWLVTHMFRLCIDAYQAHQKFVLSPKQEMQLKLMFNRGFTEGHLFHATVEQRMSHYRPNHMGIQIGTVLQYENDQVQVKLSAPLYQHDGLRILNTPIDTGLTAVRILKNGLLVSEASAGDIVWLDCKSKPAPRKGQPLQKTSDARLLAEVQKKIQEGPKRIPVQMSYTAQPGQPFVLQVTDDLGIEAKAESDILCQTAKTAPLQPEQIKTSLSKTGDQPYEVTAVSGSVKDFFLPVRTLNETRRSALQQLSTKRQVLHHRPIGSVESLQPLSCPVREVSLPAMIVQYSKIMPHPLPSVLYIADIQQQKQAETAALRPVINENDDGAAPLHDTVISQIGDLFHPLHHVIAGMTFNAANSDAIAFLLSIPGVDGVILSSEMNADQIHRAAAAFCQRYGWSAPVYHLVYGRRTLMYIKNGFIEPKTAAIADIHGQIYPVVYNDGVAKVLEPEPVHGEMVPDARNYLIFSTEEEKQLNGLQEEYNEEVHAGV